MIEYKEVQVPADGKPKPDAQKRATLPAGPHARSKATAKDKSSGTGTLPFETSDDPDTRSE